MSAMFASLSERNYRIFFTGALVSNVGTWMGRIAQDWVVLTQLTDGSASALGAITAMQFLPMLLLAPIGGSLSDRFAKRRVMFAAQTVMALTATMMGLLVLTGMVQLWHMFVLAFVQGCAAAIDSPARQAFVSELVARERVTNAVGLNSASFHTGRLVGPAVAGLLISWVDTGPTLLINAVTFAAVLLALVLLDPARLAPTPRSRGKGRIREGMRYVRHRPDILLILGIAFVHGTFGMNFQLFNAIMITEEFGRGVTEFGAIGSMLAVGSLAGALLAAQRERPRWRMLLVAELFFGTFLVAGALAPSALAYALLLVPIGLGALTVMVTANSMVQLSVDPAVRGRVMSLYLAVFMGGTPVGAPLLGLLSDTVGPRTTVLMCGVACAATAVAATIYVMRTDNIHVRLSGRLGRPLVVDNPQLDVVAQRAA